MSLLSRLIMLRNNSMYAFLQTVVLCQNMISCHDPNNFKDPEMFLPERWLTDDTKVNSRCTEAGANLVVPFGIGRRQVGFNLYSSFIYKMTNLKLFI